jgi:ferredoxin
MKKENWDHIEAYVEDIHLTLDDLEQGEITEALAISDIRDSVNDLYTVCENDYCDSCDVNVSPEYKEIIAILPDTKLSLSEMLSLKETIQRWRDEHGYPNP